MLTDNQKLWVDALRSGEYAQTGGYLSNEDGFCCLGVACDVYEKATGESLPRDVNGYLSGIGLEDKRYKVKEWLSLGSIHGFSKNGCSETLIDMNDSGVSFQWIADHIEANPEEYFYGES